MRKNAPCAHQSHEVAAEPAQLHRQTGLGLTDTAAASPVATCPASGAVSFVPRRRTDLCLEAGRVSSLKFRTT